MGMRGVMMIAGLSAVGKLTAGKPKAALLKAFLGGQRITPEWSQGSNQELVQISQTEKVSTTYWKLPLG
jgi:hypothetical protein